MIRTFDGKSPKISPSAWVSNTACIIGEVEIGENSSIWPGAVLRADLGKISIGKESQVEDNSVLHTAQGMVIGDQVHIGHAVVVHCARIGSNVLVGNNSVLLDNSEIGDNCIISAGSLVAPGSKIPPGSFVAGNPAEVRGKARPEQLEFLQKGIVYYLELTRKYKEQGL